MFFISNDNFAKCISLHRCVETTLRTSYKSNNYFLKHLNTSPNYDIFSKYNFNSELGHSGCDGLVNFGSRIYELKLH